MKARLQSMAAALAMAGCGGGGEDATVTTLQVDANETVCYAMAATWCHWTRADESRPWSLLYESIGGFDYAWGRRYTLRVKVEPLPGGGMADGPARRITLLEVLSSTALPASATFTLLSPRPADEWRQDAQGGWQLLGRPLACDATACTQLQQLAASATPVVLTFDHRNSPAGPLYLLSAVPQPP